MLKIGIIGAEHGPYGIKFLKLLKKKPIEGAEICFIVSMHGSKFKNFIVHVLNSFLKTKDINFWLRITFSTTIWFLKFKISSLISRNNLDDKSLIKFSEKLKTDVYSFDEKLGNNNQYCSKNIIQFIKKQEPDIILISHVGIMSGEILNIPRLGIINIHPGILPKYRGLRPTYWQLYNNDPVGTTVHYIDEGIDTGPILNTGTIDICHSDTIRTIEIKQTNLGVELFYKTIEGLIEQKLYPIIQKKRDGNYWKIENLTRAVRKKAKDNIKNYKST